VRNSSGEARYAVAKALKRSEPNLDGFCGVADGSDRAAAPSESHASGNDRSRMPSTWQRFRRSGVYVCRVRGFVTLSGVAAA